MQSIQTNLHINQQISDNYGPTYLTTETRNNSGPATSLAHPSTVNLRGINNATIESHGGNRNSNVRSILDNYEINTLKPKTIENNINYSQKFVKLETPGQN